MNTTKNYLSPESAGVIRGALSLLSKSTALCLASATFAYAQTPYFLSGGDFTEAFDDIADTAAWPNGFISSEPWASVAVSSGEAIPSPTTTTASTATFAAAESSSGVHRGTGSIQLLSTGSTNNSSSTAIDLLLSFTNRNAGNFSFDAATVFNGAATSTRAGTLRLFYTLDETTWTEMTGGGLPFTAVNNTVGSAAVSLALPAVMNEAPSARFRFYYHNSASAGTVSGSRPKISIDNVLVTSTGAGPDETDPTIVSLSPTNGNLSASISSPLTLEFSEPVVAGAGNVTLFSSDAPSTPVEVFAASSGSFQNTSVVFTPSSALAYSTGYFITVDATAFQDSAGNTFAGFDATGVWAFTTADEPAPVPPAIVRLTPGTDVESAVEGSVVLEIEFGEDVLQGSGSLRVFDLFGDFETPEATYDVSNASAVTVNGGTVTFSPPFAGVAGGSYFVEAPAGLFVSSSGAVNSQQIGLGGEDVQWFFDVVAPDTTPPFILSTSPQNGSGASVSPNLVANFDGEITLGAGPWTIEIYDITGDQSVQTFTEASTTGVTAGGSQLFITLDGNLSFENEYRVTLSAGTVADAAGNLSTEVTGDAWRFTTGGPFVKGQVVISQVYGGGGNSSAPLLNDYVELYNTSDSPISLSGWSVQYASATGTSWAVSNLDGVIQPGGYFLAQQSGGSTVNDPPSQPLPTPDSTGGLNMSGTNGKVALTNSTVALSGANPVADPTVSDLVGYGSADGFEGPVPEIGSGIPNPTAPGLSNTTAAIRKVAGSQDTDNNAADFIAGAPAPRNSSSPAFVPGADGSGTALASNASAGAGSLTNSIIFPSSAGSQTMKIDLTGTFSGATLTTVEIDIPSDFGTPAVGNVSISGTGAGGGTSAVSGQTIAVSGAAVSEGTTLTVSISGLTAPDVSAVATDDGFRSIAIRSAAGGGALTSLVSSPSVRVAMPVADLATLRAISLPNPKAYVIPNEVTVTYVESGGFRNQHFIQDASAGILIDDQPITLGTSYQVGDGLTNLVGTISAFRGILQLSPIAATGNVSSTGNSPAPLVITLADFLAAPDTYQSRLVRVNGVTFADSTGNFVNNGTRVLVQGAENAGFRTFFNTDYTGQPAIAGTFDMIAIGRRSADGAEAALSARILSDFIGTAPPGGTGYQDFANQFAGGQTNPNLDFDGDGVRNGLEYLFGVSSAGFTPTPQIVNGAITWPIDPTRTDVGYVVETSGNLVNWVALTASDLDLSNPNAVRYVIPSGTGPFFVRIGATFPAAP